MGVKVCNLFHKILKFRGHVLLNFRNANLVGGVEISHPLYRRVTPFTPRLTPSSYVRRTRKICLRFLFSTLENFFCCFRYTQFCRCLNSLILYVPLKQLKFFNKENPISLFRVFCVKKL